MAGRSAGEGVPGLRAGGGAVRLLAWLRRRWLLATVPPHKQCSFCPRPYVELSTRPIFDDPGGRLAHEEIRRCIDHPPPGNPDGACSTCGREWWPDFLHLDCGPVA